MRPNFTGERQSSTVVISYGFWQSRFGGRKDIIGQTLDISKEGTGLTIVGVMPPGFYIVPWANDVEIAYREGRFLDYTRTHYSEFFLRSKDFVSSSAFSDYCDVYDVRP